MPALLDLFRPSRLTSVSELPAVQLSNKSPNRVSLAKALSAVYDRGTMDSFITGISPENLPFNMPWEILEYVEYLSYWNADYSTAVDNVRNLAGTKFTIHVNGVNKRNVAATLVALRDKASMIGPRHGGGLANIADGLIVQAATYGAMAGEWILSPDLRDVVDFILINPRDIRFFWDKAEKRYVPYQKVSMFAAQEAKKRGQQVIGNHVRLNEMTFTYAAFHNSYGGPYGVPPFLAALDSIYLQRDMLKNIKSIVRKLGLLGIIDLSIVSLEQQVNESDSNYQSRVTAYLESYVPIVEQMVNDGALIHYDDLQAQTFAISRDSSSAASQLFRANQELLETGLKNFNMSQNRASSTVDTFAGLAFDLMLRSARKYQDGVASIIAHGLRLFNLLQAVTGVDRVHVQFQQQRPINRLYDAMAEAAEIKNANTLWINGLIDQEEAGERCGIEHAPVVEMFEPLVITAIAEDDPESQYFKALNRPVKKDNSSSPPEEEEDMNPLDI